MKMSDSEKKSEQEHRRRFLHKTCNQDVSSRLEMRLALRRLGRFTLQSCKTTAKKCTKKVCCTSKVAFLLIRPSAGLFVCLFVCCCCCCFFAVLYFIFCLSKLKET